MLCQTLFCCHECHSGRSVSVGEASAETQPLRHEGFGQNRIILCTGPMSSGSAPLRLCERYRPASIGGPIEPGFLYYDVIAKLATLARGL